MADSQGHLSSNKNLFKMHLNPDGPPEDGNLDELGDMVESYTAEYSNLSTTIDEIDSYMDVLEQKADNLYSELQQLLENSKQARLEMQANRLVGFVLEQDSRPSTKETQNSESEGMQKNRSNDTQNKESDPNDGT